MKTNKYMPGRSCVYYDKDMKADYKCTLSVPLGNRPVRELGIYVNMNEFMLRYKTMKQRRHKAIKLRRTSIEPSVR